MNSRPRDSMFEPTCGSGATGVAARILGRRAILCDISEDYTQMAENRLGIERLSRHDELDPSELW